MPAIDVCEPQMIRALEKRGWRVVRKPFLILVRGRGNVYADIALEEISTRRRIVVVEVKYFTQPNTVLDDFYSAVGQYLFYRNAIKLERGELPVYLAIPLPIYEELFSLPAVQTTVEDAKIKLIVADLVQDEIVIWVT
jgi:hypothetical protein